MNAGVKTRDYPVPPRNIRLTAADQPPPQRSLIGKVLSALAWSALLLFFLWFGLYGWLEYFVPAKGALVLAGGCVVLVGIGILTKALGYQVLAAKGIMAFGWSGLFLMCLWIAAGRFFLAFIPAMGALVLASSGFMLATGAVMSGAYINSRFAAFNASVGGPLSFAFVVCTILPPIFFSFILCVPIPVSPILAAVYAHVIGKRILSLALTSILGVDVRPGLSIPFFTKRLRRRRDAPLTTHLRQTTGGGGIALGSFLRLGIIGCCCLVVYYAWIDFVGVWAASLIALGGGPDEQVQAGLNLAFCGAGLMGVVYMLLGHIEISDRSSLQVR